MLVSLSAPAARQGGTAASHWSYPQAKIFTYKRYPVTVSTDRNSGVDLGTRSPVARYSKSVDIFVTVPLQTSSVSLIE
jgi:hypothetical protein